MLLDELLARQLNAQVGDKITSDAARGNTFACGCVAARKTLNRIGYFCGRAELDASMAVVNLADAAKLERLDAQAQGLRIKLPTYLMRLRVFGTC